jgi:hypothetical protein
MKYFVYLLASVACYLLGTVLTGDPSIGLASMCAYGFASLLSRKDT